MSVCPPTYPTGILAADTDPLEVWQHVQLLLKLCGDLLRDDAVVPQQVGGSFAISPSPVVIDVVVARPDSSHSGPCAVLPAQWAWLPLRPF